MTWHELTPRQQLHVMLDAEMDHLEQLHGPATPHGSHPTRIARDLTTAAAILRDIQACAVHDRIRHTPRTSPGASQ